MPITKTDLNNFVVQMREDNLSPVTCNISIWAMNSFLTWLHENSHIQERLKIKQLKTEKKVIKSYSDQELKQILSYKPRTFVQKRLYAIVSTIIDTGVPSRRIVASLCKHIGPC